MADLSIGNIAIKTIKCSKFREISGVLYILKIGVLHIVKPAVKGAFIGFLCGFLGVVQGTNVEAVEQKIEYEYRINVFFLAQSIVHEVY